MTFPLKIVGLLKSKIPIIDTDFKITINTALGTGNNFQLPLPSGQTYNFVVYWGDGNFDTITAYNQTETLHSYSSSGIYQIRIVGKCGGWSFNNGGDKLKITSVDNWGDVEFDYLSRAFYGCINLASFATDGITATSNAQDLLYFARNCSSLILTNNNANLFDNIPDLRLLQQAFQDCSSMTLIPLGLLASNTTILNYKFMFYGLNGLTGSSQQLWLTGNNTLIPPNYDSGTPNGLDCYFNCTGLSDYASIPAYWK